MTNAQSDERSVGRLGGQTDCDGIPYHELCSNELITQTNCGLVMVIPHYELCSDKLITQTNKK